MKNIITHNGTFHADDVFAIATLLLCFPNEPINIIRTRDKDKILEGDIVVDVGRVFNFEENRFDHHQEEGAGERGNGIPYASFGLIWKHYSHYLCASIEAKLIDEKLVQIVDAVDNGIDLFDSKLEKIRNYNISVAISSFNSTFLEEDRSEDDAFMEAVSFAQKIIQREIESAKELIVSKEIFHIAYEEAMDKRVVVVEENILKENFEDYTEVLYLVYPYDKGGKWAVQALKNKNTFESKKPFPREWAGKEGIELQNISGVPEAIFCHKARFIVIAENKEGALSLVDLALQS